METLSKKTTKNKQNTVLPHLPVEVVADLMKNATVEINEGEKIVFCELNEGGYHILCERLELDTDYQDITIFYDELQITDQTTITNVANWIYEYATNEIENADSGFSYQDQLHANQIINS